MTKTELLEIILNRENSVVEFKEASSEKFVGGFGFGKISHGVE